jgi:hypothetical protein
MIEAWNALPPVTQFVLGIILFYIGLAVVLFLCFILYVAFCLVRNWIQDWWGLHTAP